MTFTDFCEKMLIALYQDGHQSDDWLSFAELQGKYGLIADASWLSRAMNHLSSQRRIEGREINGAPLSVIGRITGSGMAYIEGKYGSTDGVGEVLKPLPVLPEGQDFLTTEEGEFLTTEDGNYLTTEVSSVGQTVPRATFETADWISISRRLEGEPGVVGQIADRIREIDQLIDQTSLSNVERQKAKSITAALNALVSSPEPEWKAIATLLTSPSLSAVLNVAAIVQIILALFGIG